MRCSNRNCPLRSAPRVSTGQRRPWKSATAQPARHLPAGCSRSPASSFSGTRLWAAKQRPPSTISPGKRCPYLLWCLSIMHRSDLLATLLETHEGATSGNSSLVLLSGPAGMGKSWLAEKFRQQLDGFAPLVRGGPLLPSLL